MEGNTDWMQIRSLFGDSEHPINILANVNIFADFLALEGKKEALNRLNLEQKKIFLKALGAQLALHEPRVKMSFNRINTQETIGYLKCSRRCPPPHEKIGGVQRVKISKGCSCTATMQFYFKVGHFTIPIHTVDCATQEPDPPQDFRIQEALLSPQKIDRVVTDIADRIAHCPSLKPRQLQTFVPQKMQGIAHSLVRKGIAKSRGNISPLGSYIKLIDEFKREGIRYKEVYGNDFEVSAIFYHDPKLLDDKQSYELDIYLMTTDVTHGIFASECGFTKLSLFSIIDEGRQLRVLGKAIFFF